MWQLGVIDSHTGGEPTRIVVSGGPELGSGTMRERLGVLREKFDWVRTSSVNEPRGSDVVVGALLCEPVSAEAAAGVIFFNNVGYLGMCGHGTIGLVETLRHMGRIGVGTHWIETPVGTVTATLGEDGEVSLENVASYRKASGVRAGNFVGDVAWGGNWFYLAEAGELDLSLGNVERLTEITWALRQELNAGGYPEIDHIELFGPAEGEADSRNFVLCPGKAYDRSPCGTGTSAKLACLAAEGKLAPGETWRQESIVGSVFRGSYRWEGESVIPTIAGRAWVNAEAALILDERDPFCYGIER